MTPELRRWACRHVVSVLDRAGVTQAQLARRLNVDEPRMSRMLSGDEGSPNLPFAAMQALCDLVGARAVLEPLALDRGLRLVEVVTEQPAGKDLVGQVAAAVGQVGHVGQAVISALADGRIDPLESRALRPTIERGIRELLALLELVAAEDDIRDRHASAAPPAI